MLLHQIQQKPGEEEFPCQEQEEEGFWTWHWRNPIVFGIKCLDLGEWNLLGETAEFFRWPAPGRQANISFPSDKCWCCCYWEILLVDLLLATYCPASVEACMSTGCLAEVTHSLLTKCDEFHPNSLCWHFFFPMPRQHWRIAREDDIQTDRGLVEGRLSVLEVWWHRKPISIAVFN